MSCFSILSLFMSPIFRPKSRRITKERKKTMFQNNTQSDPNIQNPFLLLCNGLQKRCNTKKKYNQLWKRKVDKT